MSGDATEPAGGDRHLVLVDGSGFIFRAYHALPPMTAPDGTPVNAVYGFTNMLLKLLADQQEGTDRPDLMAVIFDSARLTFRNDIYADYKAHRPDPPDDLIPQFALIREAVRACNVACIELEGFEADDLIASYARAAQAAGIRTTIMSGDKDLMQLVRPGVDLLDPLKNRPIGIDEVIAKFGVGPDKVVDVQALAGDSTDNVPGVPGIGVKTAAQLIEQYGDLETLLSRAEEIKQPKRRQSLIDFADQARVSRRLVELRADAPLPEDLPALAVRDPEPDALLGFLQARGFKSLLARHRDRFAAAGHETRAAAADEPALPDAAQHYDLVRDIAALKRWVDEATRLGTVAVDTETSALDALRSELVGVSLAVRPGRACYIPLLYRPNGAAASQGGLDLDDSAPAADGDGPDASALVPAAAAISVLKGLLEDPGVLKVGHNIKYDINVLSRVGIRMAPVDDTMVLSYVLDGTQHGHRLDDLANLHFGHRMIAFKDVCGTGKSQISFDQVPLDRALDYAAEDADFTLRLHRVLKPRLLADRLVAIYESFDRPLVRVLADMEQAGIKVDAAALRGLSDEFARRMADLEAEIHKLAGEPFNIGSPKQLGEILFGRMGLDGGKRSSKTGAYSTGADVLESLAAQGHDLPARVLDWRQFSKLKSTYTDALVADINPNTGRVHTSYGLTGTSTGRLSSSDPNLQNIPVRTEEGRKIRAAFVAEKDHLLLSADYSQIELRLVAHVADIAALKQAFHDGADIHAATASQVFGVPMKGMDPMVRRRAKAINFGIIYGISGFGLANQLRIPRAEAQAYIDAYFARYPEIRDYMEATKQFARDHGYVLTPFGRRCTTGGIKDKNPAMRGFAERAAINAPIQGGAADIIKRAMRRVPKALVEAGLSARMLLQVHDELLFEVPEAEVDATRDLVCAVMERAATLSVPLVVDTGVGSTWAEAH